MATMSTKESNWDTVSKRRRTSNDLLGAFFKVTAAVLLKRYEAKIENVGSNKTDFLFPSRMWLSWFRRHKNVEILAPFIIEFIGALIKQRSFQRRIKSYCNFRWFCHLCLKTSERKVFFAIEKIKSARFVKFCIKMRSFGAEINPYARNFPPLL